jgi:hypothetical protein
MPLRERETLSEQLEVCVFAERDLTRPVPKFELLCDSNPATTLTGTAADITVQRILVRLGVSRGMAAMLLDNFRDAVAHFGRHPVTVPMSKEKSSGFNHL